MAIPAVIDSFKEYVAAQPGLHWAILIDSAFDYPAAGETLYAPGSSNCYRFDAYEGLQEVAPLLLPISTDAAGQELLKRVLRHCNGRPMLSLVASRLPCETLNERWQDLHWVTDADGQRMLLRVADTRILPALPQILEREQWSAFTSTLELWLYVNREGQLTPNVLAPKDSGMCKEIRLTHAQLELMLQAAEPDAIADLIVENMPEIVPAGLKNSQFHSLVRETCVLAQNQQVQVFADVVSLSVAACLTEGESNRSAKLHRLLAEKDWVPSKLGQAIMDEEII